MSDEEQRDVQVLCDVLLPPSDKQEDSMPETSLKADSQPCNHARRLLAVNSYLAESYGYLSVERGDAVVALTEPTPGDAGCAWPTYLFCQVGDSAERQGWVPQQIFWDLFKDENGRPWISDPDSGEWRWQDEFLL